MYFTISIKLKISKNLKYHIDLNIYGVIYIMLIRQMLFKNLVHQIVKLFGTGLKQILLIVKNFYKSCKKQLTKLFQSQTILNFELVYFTYDYTKVFKQFFQAYLNYAFLCFYFK